MKRIVVVVLVLAAAVAGGLYLRARSNNEALEGSGTVEARNIHIGSKEGGRIFEVLSHEGDKVEAGQVLVKFDEEPLASKVEQMKGAVAQARANLDKLQRGYRPEEIAQARAAANEATALLDERRNGYLKEQIAQACGDYERAQADAANLEKTWRRVSDLANQDVFSKQQRDDAESAWKQGQGRLETAKQRLAELERGTRPEEIKQAAEHHHQLAANAEMMERGYRAEDIAAARATLEQTEGELREAESRLAERQVKAPSASWIEVLDVRPGDLIAPNTPIATLLERDQLFIRIYVPETRIGAVKLGQKAELRLDPFPGRTFPGVVEQINQKAEFLPRNVQTREERVHQVFGIRIRIDNAKGEIRAGMAADVKILASGS